MCAVSSACIEARLGKMRCPGVVLTLAIEFAASHLAKPHRKIIDNARELEMVRLNHEADMAKGQIADATARAASTISIGLKLRLLAC